MNWKQRIERAMKVGIFTQVDYNKSEEFPTCAIGERFGNLGKIRKKYTRSKYDKLYELGIDFFRSITHDIVDEAKIIHNQINKIKR